MANNTGEPQKENEERKGRTEFSFLRVGLTVLFFLVLFDALTYHSLQVRFLVDNEPPAKRRAESTAHPTSRH